MGSWCTGDRQPVCAKIPLYMTVCACGCEASKYDFMVTDRKLVEKSNRNMEEKFLL